MKLIYFCLEFPISNFQLAVSLAVPAYQLGFWPSSLSLNFHLFSVTGQLTRPPETTSLFPYTRPTLLTPFTPLTPQSSVGADLPQPSPSVEEPSSQTPTDKLSSQPSTYHHPSQPSTSSSLESAQMQPLSIEVEIKQLEEKYRNLMRSVLVAFQQGSVSLRDILACLMALPISLKLQLG